MKGYRIKVLFLNSPSAIGGPGTFQTNFCDWWVSNGMSVSVFPEVDHVSHCLVISGTRRIFFLCFLKYVRGVKILLRLDGWSMVVDDKLRVMSFNFVLAAARVGISAFIAKFLADVVVMQSEFVASRWSRYYLLAPPARKTHVIYNAANSKFDENRGFVRQGPLAFVSVEGAVQLDALTLMFLHQLDKNLPLLGADSFCIYGNCDQIPVSDFDFIEFMGEVPRDKVNEIYRSAGRQIFVVLERFPPCPNSMIEAICSGVPCLGVDEGSFSEIGCDACHALPVSSIGDSEMLHYHLALVIKNFENLARAAKARAAFFSVNRMMNNYKNVLESM